VGRGQARKVLALLEGPVNGWCLVCLAVLARVVCVRLSYISLETALAAATFRVILTMLTLVEGVWRTALAIQEARRDLDEWERLWTADQALQDA